MDIPTRIRFNREGTAITYLRSPGRHLPFSLWRQELDGKPHALISGRSAGARRPTVGEELWAQRTRTRTTGVTAYQRAAEANRIVAVVRGACMTTDGSSLGTALAGPTDVRVAEVSPDGRRIALVRDGDVWFVEIDSDASPKRLTTDAKPGVTNGLADFIASEELSRYEGMWWSSDSGALLFANVDEQRIPSISIGSAHSGGLEEHRYPFPGGPNASVRLRVAAWGQSGNDEPKGRDVALNLDDRYLARVVPHPGGGWLLARLDRDQRCLGWYHVGADGQANALWDETAGWWPWLNLDTATWVLSDGRVLRATERSGFRHLELRAPDGGTFRALTDGPWVVTELVHVDERRGEALLIGTYDGVLERHLYAVPLDATRPVQTPARLTKEPGWHAVVFSDDGDRWADTWSTHASPPRVAIRSRNAEVLMEIEARGPKRQQSRIVAPELRTVTAADGTTPLQVAVFRPRRGSGGARGQHASRLAVVWVYGGPHSQSVADAWEQTVQPARQSLVRAGFTVVIADNRGTANRGMAFESVIAGRLGEIEVQDQAVVVEALIRRDELDPHGIGITGWSYGGFMTIRAMRDRPDLFRAGVAGAPVVAWDGYDTAYSERYLGTPAERPEAYEASSVASNLEPLTGEVLVIHGSLDENVHFRHTERLLEAMQDAGHHTELMVVPGERHSLRSARIHTEILRRTANFLRQSLTRGLGEPSS